MDFWSFLRVFLLPVESYPENKRDRMKDTGKE